MSFRLKLMYIIEDSTRLNGRRCNVAEEEANNDKIEGEIENNVEAEKHLRPHVLAALVRLFLDNVAANVCNINVYLLHEVVDALRLTCSLKKRLQIKLLFYLFLTFDALPLGSASSTPELAIPFATTPFACPVYFRCVINFAGLFASSERSSSQSGRIVMRKSLDRDNRNFVCFFFIQIRCVPLLLLA